jgi:hypothetical protein
MQVRPGCIAANMGRMMTGSGVGMEALGSPICAHAICPPSIKAGTSPRHATSSHIKPRQDTKRHATFRHAMLRHHMCHATLFHVMPGNVTACHGMIRQHETAGHVMARHVMLCQMSETRVIGMGLGLTLDDDLGLGAEERRLPQHQIGQLPGRRVIENNEGINHQALGH